MYNKSQAALEFLMTYGWALLMVIAGITALAYFGIQKTEVARPDMCFVEYPFACVDVSYSGSNISFLVMNNAGLDAENVNITIEADGIHHGCAYISAMPNGAEEIITCTLPSLKTGKLDAPMTLSYTSPMSSLRHVKQGSIMITVK